MSSAALDLHWTPPSSSDIRVSGTVLAPRYGLVTSSVDADGRKVATEYADPATGLATATIMDPAGLALRSTTSFEATGTGFYRQLSRALPKAVGSGVASEKVTYGYYGATETATNPCPSGASSINQGGAAKITTEADPDGAGTGAAIQREAVHDAAGRTVASRVVADGSSGWACTTYDLRGRVTHQVDRVGGETAVDFTTTAGTVTTTFSDSAGATRTTTTALDLLGRTVRYTDELGTQTRYVYDQAGRPAATYRTFAGGTEAQVTSATYDAAGRVLTASDLLSGSVRTTTTTYDAAGRPRTTTRANGVGSTSVFTPTGQLGALAFDVPTMATSTAFSHTYSLTGGAQTWTVPAGVTSVTATAAGGAGGAGYTINTRMGGTGGAGGSVTATLAVVPGEVLQIDVGGKGPDGCTSSCGSGGFGGGGGSIGSGGRGGGASDVRRGGTGLADRVLVAGGGGGGGGAGNSNGGNGGNGGSTSGGSGVYFNSLTGGAGGASGDAGGAGGAGGVCLSNCGDYGSGTAGAPGALDVGGSGIGGGSGGGGLTGGGAGGSSAAQGISGVGFSSSGAGGGGGGANFVSGTSMSSSIGTNSGDGQVTLSWSTTPAPVATYTYSLGGRITTEIVTNAGDRQRDFTYDAAGRLTQTVDGSTTRSYTYDKNTNRCRVGTGTGCDTTNWGYDAADRITKSPYASAYTYDTHGSLTSTTGTSGNPSAAITYDANDHATVVEDGTTRVAETLAPSGRVLRRVVTTIATGTVTEDTSYGYAGPGDSPAYSKPTSGSTVTTYLTGMGGLVDVGGTATWSLYSAHGDVLGTTNAAGAYTAAPQADEFGVGTAPGSRLGWLGQQQRPSVGALGLFRMGVRLYDPALGRFASVDPVEGGSANDYDYCNGDPVNCYDLAGTLPGLPHIDVVKGLKKAVSSAVKVVTKHPIGALQVAGTVAAAVSVGLAVAALSVPAAATGVALATAATTAAVVATVFDMAAFAANAVLGNRGTAMSFVVLATDLLGIGLGAGFGRAIGAAGPASIRWAGAFGAFAAGLASFVSNLLTPTLCARGC